MNSENSCCNGFFPGFTFRDIRNALPPETKGVYIIRVKQRGKPVREIVEQVEQVIQGLNWPIVGKKMLNRIKRLEKIGLCPVIYIGSAGTQRSSSHTLKGRYKDFAGRHTAMYPLWALLYFGWELEYGWRGEEDPAGVEEHLKQMYKQRHEDRLPALVHR
ncbi:MAG: hypothetical protein ACETWB_05225 [Anaerolineae bacterium]